MAGDQGQGTGGTRNLEEHLREKGPTRPDAQTNYDRRDRRIFNHNSLEDLKEAVTYHPPSLSKTMAHANLRAGALVFMEAIAANVPECADKTDAIRKVREALFTANAGVALEGLI